MTAKELKHLSRNDLLEMLLALSKENDQLRRQLDQATKALEDRQIRIQEAGSLAEASLQLNGVFEAAQAACEQYAENLRYRSEHLEEICRQMEQETREKCDRMLTQAKARADEYLAQAQKQVEEQANAYSLLTDLMTDSRS